MGKHSRRKNRKGNNAKGTTKGNSSSTNSATVITSPSSTSPSTSSPIIQKIRHGDVKVRHGALSALSSTLFSPESLSSTSSSKSKGTIKIELLQAVMERIMDEDLPSALCAAGCIANYILFQESNSNSNTNRVETILAPILFTRMDKVCNTIEKLGQKMVQEASPTSTAAAIATGTATTTATQRNNKEQTSKKKKQQRATTAASTPASSTKQIELMASSFMEQFALLSLCLHALCGLVENISANNTSSSILFHQRDQFLSSTMRAFNLAKHMISSLFTPTSNSTTASDANANANINNSFQNDTVKNILIKKENELNLISDVLTYTSRTIHSSSDDNPTFIQLVLANTNWSDDIISTISNMSLPALSRLHCAGFVINTRHSIAYDISSSSTSSSSSGNTTTTTTTTTGQLQQIQSNLETTITTQILPLLSSSTFYSNDVTIALWKQIEMNEIKLKEEQQDELIEKNVISIVDGKKESARQIARRQKQIKAAAKAVAKAAKEAASAAKQQDSIMKDGGDDDDDDDDDSGDDDDDAMKTQEMCEDNEDKSKHDEITEDKYDKAVNAWKNAHLPLKLSVEIIANLCAGRNRGGEGELHDNHAIENDDDDDDDMVWGLEEEERLLASGKGLGGEVYRNKEDEQLFNTIISSGVPDRVLSIFGNVILSLIQNGRGNDNGDVSKSNDVKHDIPSVVLEDLSEILTKYGICLGNILCNLGEWKSNESDLTSVWNEFLQCLRAAMDGEKVDYANKTLPCSAISAVMSTMNAFLRFRSSLASCVNEQDLDLILSYVLLEAPLSTSGMEIDANSDRQDMEDISDIQKDAIGLLGILCSEPHPSQINEKICKVFLIVLSRIHSTSTKVMSEILNALMDIYALDEDDPNNHENVFRDNHVLDAFQKSVPVLKRKIREEKGGKASSSVEDIEFFKETALNASRFINYKKGL